MSRIFYGLILAVTAMSVASGSVQGAILHNNFGLASPDQTITFEEIILADATPLTTQYSSLGVTFTNMYYNSEDPAGKNWPNLSGHVIQNYPGPAQNYAPILNPFAIYFTTLKSSVAMAVVTNPGDNLTISAYLGGVLQETGTFATSLHDPINFYGFTGITLDELRMSAPYNVNGAAVIDMLQSTDSAVPEPSSIALLGLGTFGLVMRSLRRRRAITV